MYHVLEHIKNIQTDNQERDISGFDRSLPTRVPVAQWLVSSLELIWV